MSTGLNADPQERSFREEGSCKSRVCPLQAVLAHVRQRFALCWKKKLWKCYYLKHPCVGIFTFPSGRSQVPLKGAVIRSDIHTAISQFTKPFIPHDLKCSLTNRTDFQRKKLRHGQFKCPDQDQAVNFRMSRSTVGRVVLSHHSPARGYWGEG